MRKAFPAQQVLNVFSDTMLDILEVFAGQNSWFKDSCLLLKKKKLRPQTNEFCLQYNVKA